MFAETPSWTVAWGDVAAWVGALGTLGAAFWAVFLFKRTLKDGERAQARLLAPVGRAVPVQALPGTPTQPESAGTQDLLGFGADGRAIVIAEAYMAKVRLVSTSEEAFSGLSASLLMEDGREVAFPLGFSEIAPREEKSFIYYYPPGNISGSMRVRLRFKDANGQAWERISGEPVRLLRRDRKYKSASG